MSDVKCCHIKMLLSSMGMFDLMTPNSNKNLGCYSTVKGLNLSMDKGVTEETALAIEIFLGGCTSTTGQL